MSWTETSWTFGYSDTGDAREMSFECIYKDEDHPLGEDDARTMAYDYSKYFKYVTRVYENANYEDIIEDVLRNGWDYHRESL